MANGVSKELNDQLLLERLLARGREDDNQTVILNRLSVYQEKTAPLIRHFEKQGLLKKIQGDGDIKAIAERIEKILS